MNKTAAAVNIFNTYASSYAQKYLDVSQYSIGLNILCENIKTPNASLLELACGPGNVTQYVLGKKPELNILATDLAVEMIKIAKTNNPTVSTQLLDSREITSLGTTFDAIICAFGLPYLSKEEAIQLLKDAASSLTDGGVLYISTMEDDYDRSNWAISSSGDKMYIYYHQADYLLKAMEEGGLSLIYKSLQPALNGDNDLIIIARK